MRKERITLNNAVAVWSAIQKSVKLCGQPLPAIDMAAIFAGRKSMTARAVVEAVTAIIAKLPTA